VSGPFVPIKSTATAIPLSVTSIAAIIVKSRMNRRILTSSRRGAWEPHAIQNRDDCIITSGHARRIGKVVDHGRYTKVAQSVVHAPHGGLRRGLLQNTPRLIDIALDLGLQLVDSRELFLPTYPTREAHVDDPPVQVAIKV
jgi:hypothetical protein